jgi:hypothetical protein
LIYRDISMATIQVLSALSAILAGVLILIMWIVAAHDRGVEDGNKYKCRGCIYYYHDDLVNSNIEIKNWYMLHRDSYNLLIAFGVICGVFWMAAGGVGFIVSNEMLGKVNIILGAVTYTIFVVLFAILANRMKYAASYVPCYSRCSTTDDWFIRHSNDSIHEFWGSSLACFILGAFHLLGAIYTYATLSPNPPLPVQNIPNTKPKT